MVQICAARVVRGRPSVLEVHGQTANRSARREGVPLCARLACMPVTKKERQLSLSLFFGNRQRPILPGRVQPSTIGAEGLNCCVRDVNRCFPFAIVTGIVEYVLRTFTTA